MSLFKMGAYARYRCRWNVTRVLRRITMMGVKVIHSLWRKHAVRDANMTLELCDCVTNSRHRSNERCDKRDKENHNEGCEGEMLSSWRIYIPTCFKSLFKMNSFSCYRQNERCDEGVVEFVTHIVRDAYTHMLQITIQNEFVFTLPLKWALWWGCWGESQWRMWRWDA